MVPSVAPPMSAVTERREAAAGRAGPAGACRIAGLCALGFIASIVVDSAGSGNPTAIAPPHAAAWVLQHQQAVAVHGFLGGLENVLYALFTVLLLAAIGARGPLPIIAYVGVAASVATGGVLASTMYGLVALAAGGGSDASIQTLFVLGNSMLDADNLAVVLALGCLGIVLLRSRALPVPLGWLAVVLSVGYLLDMPLTFAGVGIINPLLLGLAMLWLLAMGVLLLVRPVGVSGLDSQPV